MSSIQRIGVISTAGLLGLCLAASCLRSRPSVHPVPFSTAPPPHSPATAALRRAAQFRTRAKLDASQKRDDLEAWDPQAAITGLNAEDWRLQQLALDRSGDLHRA